MRIAIFRHALGRVSESFVLSQAESLLALNGGADEVRLFCVEDLRENADGTTAWAMSSTRAGRLQTPLFQLSRRSPSLHAQLRDWRPDVILAHFASDGWRISHIASSLQIPLAVVIHGSDVLTRDEEAWRLGRGARSLAKRWPEFIERTSLFLPVSGYLAAALVDRGVPTEKIWQHYLGTQVPGEVTGPDVKDWDVIFVGRLERNKGCSELLSAISQGLSGDRVARVLVVGDGPERQALLNQAAQLDARKVHVEFAGALDVLQAKSLMKRSRVLCAPSVVGPTGASEGFGLASIEAQALGVPVVVYDTGGLAETCSNGFTGLVVPSGDVRRLHMALGLVLRDEGLSAQMRLAGPDWVRSHFEIDEQNRRLLALFRERFNCP